MNTLKLVIIDSNYCDYLRGFDSKVAYNYAKRILDLLLVYCLMWEIWNILHHYIALNQNT